MAISSSTGGNSRKRRGPPAKVDEILTMLGATLSWSDEPYLLRAKSVAAANASLAQQVNVATSSSRLGAWAYLIRALVCTSIQGKIAAAQRL